MQLSETVILVTGAASGLGKAMSEAFLSEGATVVGGDVDTAGLRETEEHFSDRTGRFIPIEADVRSWDDVTTMVKTAREEVGPIDVLVNNAGVTQRLLTDGEERKKVVDIDVGVWKSVIETNLVGPFQCTKAVLPEMLERGSGRIIHISSGMSRNAEGRGTYSPYVASKHGLRGLATCLADELSDTGVDSLSLRPPSGSVYTETREYLPKREQEKRHDPEVIQSAGVALVSGAGQNGGEYVATVDGEGFEEFEDR